MIIKTPAKHHRSFVVLACMLLISGCQSMPRNNGLNTDIEQFMPSTNAQTQYSYIIDAIQSFDKMLSGKRARLTGINPDPTLLQTLQGNAVKSDSSPNDTLLQLAETKLIVAAGPYQLVYADTMNGRLEYRSESSGSHISVNVSLPIAAQNPAGISFVVSDMFSQMSLSALARLKGNNNDQPRTIVSPPIENGLLLMIGQPGVTDDASLLSYFNALPIAERDREDILVIRALLSMQLSKYKQARLLVEQGIVRYPNSPYFFNIASLLFEKSSNAGNSQPESLNKIIRERFKAKNISKNKRIVMMFLEDSTRFRR